MQNYQYQVTSVELSMSSAVEGLLLDNVTGQAKKATIPRSHSQTFQIVTGVHPNDPQARSIASRHHRESDVDDAERKLLSVSVIEVLDRLADSAEPVTPEAAIAALSATGTTSTAAVESAPPSYQRSTAFTKSDARFDSVVVVRSLNGGLGTGFFVEPNLIITNAHVVQGSKIAEIKLFSGQVVTGSVFRVDIGLDMALIKVSAAGTPVSFFAGQLLIGDTAEAIGHPAKLEFSLTRGIVSAVRRHRIAPAVDVVVIQTDAAINPGNSGGPLFVGNQVVGVNTFRLRGSDNLGFALHASEVQKFLRQ